MLSTHYCITGLFRGYIYYKRRSIVVAVVEVVVVLVEVVVGRIRKYVCVYIYNITETILLLFMIIYTEWYYSNGL